MEIKSFDRANLKVLSMDINETLQAVGKKYGISIKTNGGTFDHISFRLKVECSVMQDGNVISKEETCFKQYASMYGMKPEDLGKNIIVGGKAYKVIADYIQKNDSKCILLSATPYNKDYLDLASQLRLFVPPDKDLGVGPQQLLQEMGEIEFVRQHQCGIRTLAARSPVP